MELLVWLSQLKSRRRKHPNSEIVNMSEMYLHEYILSYNFALVDGGLKNASLTLARCTFPVAVFGISLVI